jgi:6-phosphogluconolactonase (cycloisomerase 2 family)
MKWNGLGQLTSARGFRASSRGIKTVAVSLAVGLGMTACSRDYTLSYLYVTSITRNSTGLVNEYSVDYQSGSISPLAQASIATGANPVALVASPDSKNLYVVNHGQTGNTDSSISHYAIGTDGKLYPQETTNVVQNAGLTVFGSFPISAAIDPAGNFLYVTFLYQNGYTTLNPGPGGVAVFPITHSSDATKNGALGAPLVNTTVGTTAANPLPYFPVGDNPVGVFVAPKGGYVYVVDQEKPANAAAYGVLLAFTQNTDGSLTPIPGPVSGGFAAGTTPAAVAVDAGGHFIYVTDETTNQLYGFVISAGGAVPAGAPVAMVASPFGTGSFPTGLTVDPRGLYVYVTNYGSSTLSAYAINQSTGALSGITSGSGTGVGTGPQCVTIEPALGTYLFTSNYLDNSISAEKLQSETGSLSAVQGTPFSTAAFPSCAVAVANGAHATQFVD